MISLINHLIHIARAHNIDAHLFQSIFIEAAKMSYNDVYQEHDIDTDIQTAINHTIYSIKHNIPISRITHCRYFHDSYFYISPFVFDPRADTSILVDLALEHKPKSILDIGTGSGSILISILKQMHASIGVGYDTSKYALHNALHNANLILHNSYNQFIDASMHINTDYNYQPQETQCFFIDQDTQLDQLCSIHGKFDVIVSNPPYIRRYVDQRVKFDPPIALYYQKDIYPCIFNIARKFLHKNGLLMIEIPEYLCNLYLKESKYFLVKQMMQFGDVCFASLSLKHA